MSRVNFWVAGCALILAACGGQIADDDAGPPPPTPTIEASAMSGSDDAAETTSSGPVVDGQAVAFVCPSSPPTPDGACGLVPPNNGCVYVVDSECSSAFLCASSRWMAISCP